MSHGPWLYRVALPARRRRAYREARRNGQQFCKPCGRAQDEMDFRVSAATWAVVVPARWQRTAVCLACFDRFAAESDVHTVKVFLIEGP